MKATRILTILVVVLAIMVCQAKVSEAGPMGTGFTYQGHLMDKNKPADGLYDLRFKLYDDPNFILGNQLGSGVQEDDVDVIDGYFTLELDFGSDVLDGNAVWLEMGVRPGELEDPNVYTILEPRLELTPVPYALYAKTTSRLEVMVPKGAIIMWSGTIDGNGNPVVDGTADTNWQICDGTGGTPNLRGRFIVGSGGSYSVGATGGENTHRLSTSEMPRHRHYYSGYTNSTGSHSHTYDDRYDSGEERVVGAGPVHARDNKHKDLTRQTDSAGSHHHYYSGNTDYQGGNAAHENRPPYYALAYIMRVQ